MPVRLPTLAERQQEWIRTEGPERAAVRVQSEKAKLVQQTHAWMRRLIDRVQTASHITPREIAGLVEDAMQRAERETGTAFGEGLFEHVGNAIVSELIRSLEEKERARRRLDVVVVSNKDEAKKALS